MSVDANHPGTSLLPIARAAISTALGRSVEVAADADWLHELGATFVTLTQRGELRGCVGTVQSRRTLLEDVQANAVAAALRDTRFAPLTLRELSTTRIEVSLLSPMQTLHFESQAHALAQLVPGVDGVLLEYAQYRSTFLPRVWEQLPSPSEFMAHLKHKAGLPPDFWAEGLRLQRYTVTKWKEPQAAPSGLAGELAVESGSP